MLRAQEHREAGGRAWVERPARQTSGSPSTRATSGSASFGSWNPFPSATRPAVGEGTGAGAAAAACRLPSAPRVSPSPLASPSCSPPRPSQGVSHARMQLRGGSHPSSRDPASDTHRGKMLPQRPHEQAKEFFQLGLALGPQRRAAQLNNPPNALIAHWSAPLPWRAPFSDPFGAARKSPLPAGPPWLPPSRARVTGSCGPASLQPAAAHLCGAWDSP